MNNETKVLLLDSNSLINRAFHALPPLMNTDGLFTNAIYGYLTMLNKLIIEERPTHICAVFDCRAKTFRHLISDKYKATRKPMPEELSSQIPILQDLLKKMGITVLFQEGYEADDILGTLAKKINMQTIIVSGDRDCLQLVDDTTTIYNTRRGITDIKIYTPKILLEEGFTPQQIIEYKGLAGDSSDNISGCPGVGDKTAKELLSNYGSIEGIYNNIDKIQGKLKERLIDNRETVLLSKKLATIDTDAKVEFILDNLLYPYILSDEAKDLMYYLQFKNLIEKFTFSNQNEAKNNISAIENKKTNIFKPKSIETKTIYLTTKDELSLAIKSIPNNSIMLFDYCDNKAIICIDGYTYEIQTVNNLLGDGISDEEFSDAIKPLFGKNYINVFFDAKHIFHILQSLNIKVEQPYDDLLLMGYLINNTKVIKSKKQLLEDYNYCTENMYASLLGLYSQLKEKIKDKNLTKLYYEIELPLIEVLFDMEKVGFRVDLQILETLNVKYTEEINKLLQEIYDLAGQNFNVNSTKQLGAILFDKLGLSHSKKTKTGYSVDAETLEELEHPIVNAILRYRELAKLKSTYIEGMKSVMNPITGKVHTSFKQCLTSTGRLSSTEPNLQNIPIRKNEGREIRKMFIPSQGCILVTADYSQIELRLLAHFSEEPKLIEAYNRNEDIHSITASKIFNMPLNLITPEMRSSAKAVNFGIIYGISRFGLSKNAGVTRYQAKKFIEQYFETYPKVKEYMDNNVALAKKQGYLTTLFGRLRYFPELTSPKHNIRAFGERASMNMPLQGTASDIIKIAMLKVYNSLKEKNLKSKLILQVHDELIINASIEEKEIVKKLLKECMESAVSLSIPLIANVSSGKNWYESK